MRARYREFTLIVLLLTFTSIGLTQTPTSKPDAKNVPKTAPLSPAKPAPKQPEPFRIYNVQKARPQFTFGLGDDVRVDIRTTLSARVIVNKKGDARAIAPSPATLTCYFYDHKKEQVGVSKGIFYKVTNNEVAEVAPTFRSRVPEEIFFPYNANLRWNYAIIAVGDSNSMVAAGFPSLPRNLDDFSFSEKSLLEKK